MVSSSSSMFCGVHGLRRERTVVGAVVGIEGIEGGWLEGGWQPVFGRVASKVRLRDGREEEEVGRAATAAAAAMSTDERATFRRTARTVAGDHTPADAKRLMRSSDCDTNFEACDATSFPFPPAMTLTVKVNMFFDTVTYLCCRHITRSYLVGCGNPKPNPKVSPAPRGLPWAVEKPFRGGEKPAGRATRATTEDCNQAQSYPILKGRYDLTSRNLPKKRENRLESGKSRREPEKRSKGKDSLRQRVTTQPFFG